MNPVRPCLVKNSVLYDPRIIIPQVLQQNEKFSTKNFGVEFYFVSVQGGLTG